ncbi:MAG: TonB-dependent receptor, partial [Spirochaetota bacterium]
EVYYNMLLFSHRLLLGLNGNVETLKGAALGEKNESAAAFAFYLQDTWNVGSADKFYLALGGRLDLNPPSRAKDKFLVHMAPKFSLRWNPSQNLNFQASYGIGYKTPTLKEKYYVHNNSAHGYKVYGNPNLKPEISHGVNLNTSWQPQKWLELGLSGYFNYLIDMIASRKISTTGSGRTAISNYSYKNVDEAITAGADLSVKLALEMGLGLDLGYSWLIVAQEKTQDTKAQFVDMWRKSKHQLKGSISYRLKVTETLFRLGFRWQAAQKYQTGSSYLNNLKTQTSPDLLLFDLRMEQPLPGGFQLYGGIENLLDNLHFAKGTETAKNSQKHFYSLHDGITFFIGASYSN